MADETICFSGSSAEEIEQAKLFWKSIYPPAKPKSALNVKGIDHRLHTAQKPQNEVNYAHHGIEYFKTQDMDPALDRYKQDAERQRILEEAEYAEKMQEFRKEAQYLNQKRKQERMKKEEISSKVMQRTHDQLIQISDSEEEDEEGRQAMDDIEKFEARLVQQEKLKPS
ncbi:UPF0722 protein C11orf88 homolog [Actinia tenebrosa]|uniref:Cilia- and flagella-associated protein HOATZ n=1 Tax=Actinia tenebrosa TaxID=6105 RepID=A0A6P8HEM8_ACTTE|nr:UPF0722 protein C11orf88 homolog [Actinia tenebrosa]